MSVSLIKPTAIGTALSIKNSEGEPGEWVVIGHERKNGRYTGYLRVQHKGWLSASVLESKALEDSSGSSEVELISCDFTHGCTSDATRWGLLAVSNGVTAYVATCEYHSYRWNDLWGSWPLDVVDVDAAHAEALSSL